MSEAQNRWMTIVNAVLTAITTILSTLTMQSCMSNL